MLAQEKALRSRFRGSGLALIGEHGCATRKKALAGLLAEKARR
jgi:trehalose-6-phosphatase